MLKKDTDGTLFWCILNTGLIE